MMMMPLLYRGIVLSEGSHCLYLDVMLSANGIAQCFMRRLTAVVCCRRKAYPKCQDVALVVRTRAVHARVVAASQLVCREANPAWHWRLHVYEESSPALLNASAFPCSQMCIASGMVAECRSDDELAGEVQLELKILQTRPTRATRLALAP